MSRKESPRRGGLSRLMALVFILALAVSVSGTANARPDGPGMAKKRSATTDIAGYDK